MKIGNVADIEMKGYYDYFEGKPYNYKRDPNWINGWTKAERASNCGWFTITGTPNASINKIKH